MTHIIQFGFSHSWASAVLVGLREGARLVQEKYETVDWFDGVMALEDFEEIFGTTCVVAQACINRTWADITKYELKVNPTEKRWQIVPLFGRKVGQSSTTQVELIYHLANYWKHHDSWPNWTPEPGEARYHTVQTLASVGIDRDTDFPCVRGLQLIAPADDTLFSELEDILAVWCTAAVDYHLAESSDDS